MLKLPAWLVVSAMLLAATPAAADQVDSPSFAYLLHCAGCHLEHGRGDPPEIPDLHVELGELLKSPQGRDYVLRVPGITDATVTPDQMADLLNWMIAEFYPDRSDFEPFTAEEVLAGRQNPLYDPITHRRRLLVELNIVTEGGN